MLKLNQIRSDKIWGYELWIASTHPNGCQEEFKNAVGGDYPLLVKVIQADDTLSIQVHPDDELAVKLEGPGNRGKQNAGMFWTLHRMQNLFMELRKVILIRSWQKQLMKTLWNHILRLFL